MREHTTEATEGGPEQPPVPEPAASGSPPRRPPTAVGAGDAQPDDDPWSGGGAWPLPPNILDTPVGNVGIPTRAVAALERAGVKTLRQLLQLSDQDVLRIPGIGRATLAKLIRALRDIGVLAEDH